MAEFRGNNIAHRRNAIDLSITAHRHFVLFRDRFVRVRFARAVSVRPYWTISHVRRKTMTKLLLKNCFREFLAGKEIQGPDQEADPSGQGTEEKGVSEVHD